MKQLALVGVVALLSGSAVGAQAPRDPVLGTWELNVAKSKFVGPAPKAETRTFVQSGEDIKVTSKGIDAEGKATTGAWTLNYDGKDRPLTGTPEVDSLSITRTDPYYAVATNKKNGKVVTTVTRVISPDGKTMTFTAKGATSKGPVNDVSVFEKR